MFVIACLEQQSEEVKSDSGSGPHLGTRRTLPCLSNFAALLGHMRGEGDVSPRTILEDVPWLTLFAEAVTLVP